MQAVADCAVYRGICIMIPFSVSDWISYLIQMQSKLESVKIENYIHDFHFDPWVSPPPNFVDLVVYILFIYILLVVCLFN